MTCRDSGSGTCVDRSLTGNDMVIAVVSSPLSSRRGVHVLRVVRYRSIGDRGVASTRVLDFSRRSITVCGKTVMMLLP